MQNDEGIYLRDLKRIQQHAKKTLVHSRPFGLRLLDTCGPGEIKGRFSLIAGTTCSTIMFFVGLHSGFAARDIAFWCVVAALAAGLFSVLICPWKTYQQYLSGVLSKCSDDTRLIPLRETIDRADLDLYEKCHTIIDMTSMEINKYNPQRKEN